MELTPNIRFPSCLLTERITVEYDEDEKFFIDNYRDIVLLEIARLNRKPKTKIYPNQEDIANSILHIFRDKRIIDIMVLSKTQSGKTGSMCAFIKKLLEDRENYIPIENIYIITGLSSIEWIEQTKERMPKSIQENVIHRCDLLEKFVDEIKSKKNILIIMDEIQVAAKKNQTIYKAFKNAGILNKETLYEKDIKILEYTATPDGTIYDLAKWNDETINSYVSAKIMADPGKGYISSYDLLRMGRVKQYKELFRYLDKKTKEIDLSVLIDIAEIKSDVDSFDIPRYHIIRTRNSDEQDLTISMFKQVFSPLLYNFVKYDGENTLNINHKIEIKPDKHTFIFIKEMLRCAKTLECKDYLGILYDRYSSSVDDTAIIQGLVGRLTGYNDNGISICYTNTESIEKYELLWNSKFEDKSIPWFSKTTKFKNGKLFGDGTFNDPSLYEGFDDEDDVSEDREPEIKIFLTYEDAINYYNTQIFPHLGGRGPKRPIPNSEGFYEACIRSKIKIYSNNEIYNERKWGITSNSYRFHPCYRDIKDKKTLEFWLVYNIEI